MNARGGRSRASFLLVFALTLSFPRAALAAEISNTSQCSRLFSATLGPTPGELNSLHMAGGDLFSIAPKSAPQTAALNEALLKDLADLPLISRKGEAGLKAVGLTQDGIERLFADAMENPQVRESLCGGYNGSSKSLGFCWGRAMAMHLKALGAGLPNRSVRKLWAVGDLKNAGTEWRYHVTTLVRHEDGSWYAVDPIFGRPLKADEWFLRMRSEFDAQKTMRIYSSPASRFSPNTWAKYRRAELSKELYHSFFADLLNSIHRENTGRPGAWAGSDLGPIPADVMRKLKSSVRPAAWAITGLGAVYLTGLGLSSLKYEPKKRPSRSSTE
ncbi:MAG: transglutaminase domain-containing protein [Proteobacteria bacterium]|nr:MAG: transglutaminase domain-containing protein [Pseudomonadota bacterium]